MMLRITHQEFEFAARASTSDHAGECRSKNLNDRNTTPPTVRLVRHSCQPSEAELEEDLRMDASLAELDKPQRRR
ncbi:MAG: hypothetical protein OXN97_14665 [Bryobacterales bacterium]|nr:hypothetical protein [Bryobacterales bacterium]